MILKIFNVNTLLLVLLTTYRIGPSASTRIHKNYNKPRGHDQDDPPESDPGLESVYLGTGPKVQPPVLGYLILSDDDNNEDSVDVSNSLNSIFTEDLNDNAAYEPRTRHKKNGLRRSIQDYDSYIIAEEISPSHSTSPFHSTKPLLCGCQIGTNMTDLGPRYYPRYIREAVCGSGSCGPSRFRCKAKKYKMTVVRPRLPDEDLRDRGQLLPDSLRAHWVAELKEVAVACECS